MSKFRAEDSDKKDDKKKDSYKSKRSFTRNKTIRKSQFEKGRSGGFKKKFGDKPDRGGEGFNRNPTGRRPFREDNKRDGREGKKDRPGLKEDRERGERSFGERKKPFERERKTEKRPFDGERRDRKESRPGTKRDERSGGKSFERGEREKRVRFSDFEEGRTDGPKKRNRYEKEGFKEKKSAPPRKKESEDGLIRLNKYLANAGIASRREADNLIQSGTVKVNGIVVDQLGYKIKPGDKVTYGDAAVKSERKVYLLLNKPKDYITTVDDPKERKTVMELIAGACRERVYPVGRLDRNTTGLLLFTNDGELTTKLTHPKFGVKKVYHVSLNKGLKTTDFKAIIDGLELEDGPVKVDDLAFVGEGKKEIGIEIHSGRNRIVRRIFEHLGYDVIKLDRVVFAGLTKKDLPRGKYRFLTQKEIGFLQMIG